MRLFNLVGGPVGAGLRLSLGAAPVTIRAGRPKKRRHYIEIDGQLIAVSSMEEAQDLLAKRREAKGREGTRPQLKQKKVVLRPSPGVTERVTILAPVKRKYFPEVTPKRIEQAVPMAAYDQELEKAIQAQAEEELLILWMMAA